MKKTAMAFAVVVALLGCGSRRPGSNSDTKAAQPKVQEVGMKYTVLVGNDAVADGFGGLIGFPTTFVVTKDWKIYKKYLGALPNKQDRIRQDIEKLLAAEDHAD